MATGVVCRHGGRLLGRRWSPGLVGSGVAGAGGTGWNNAHTFFIMGDLGSCLLLRPRFHFVLYPRARAERHSFEVFSSKR